MAFPFDFSQVKKPWANNLYTRILTGYLLNPVYPRFQYNQGSLCTYPRVVPVNPSPGECEWPVDVPVLFLSSLVKSPTPF